MMSVCIMFRWESKSMLCVSGDGEGRWQGSGDGDDNNKEARAEQKGTHHRIWDCSSYHPWESAS